MGAELAVRDLGALLSFLATPEDSLSLATVLRSPLFGWSEQQLFELANRREAPLLWQALRDRKEEFPETMAIISDLMAQSDFLRPYDLIERVLTRHLGRRNLLARLGSEAEDGINALLSQALAYERSSVPSLTGFLIWMETDDLEIKRQMDSAGNRVRVMTVHGSKGLEAPIVILPDTGRRLIRNDGQIVDHENTALWSMPSTSSPRALKQARAVRADTLAAERQRLLYVAMTRAEKWLIVAAAGELGKDGLSWYDAILSGLGHLGAEPCELPGGQGLRYSVGDWSGSMEENSEPKLDAVLNLPEFVRTRPPEIPQKSSTVSPSDLGGAKALPSDAGKDEEAAKRYGTMVHLLLEHLPGHQKSEWLDVATNVLSAFEGSDIGDNIAEALAEAAGVLDVPEIGFLFAPETLAEVPVTAPLGSERMHGVVDRLVVTDNRVTIVDFKTNAGIPDTPEKTPEGLLRQMGAYAHAISKIYPEHVVETGILWTRTATLMMLPHDLVTKALADTGYLDLPGVAP